MESRINPSSDDEDRRLDERLDKLARDIKKLSPDRVRQLEKLVKSMGKKEVVSIKEAAEILGCSVDTVRRAIQTGSLRGFQINKMGNWKIPVEEIERFMRGESR